MENERRFGQRREDAERAISHYGITYPEYYSNPEKYPLPPRGTGLERGTAASSLSDEDIEQVAEAVVEKFKEDESLLLHSVPYVEGSPGIVVDSDVAAGTSCKCARVDGSEICFSKGIIGGMSEGQKEAYCNPKTYMRSPRLEKRIREFKEAVVEAKEKIKGVPKGERLEPWLKAMSEELTERGIEL